METKTQSPAFTVSLRGYDREEVDEYLDSLAEALAQVEEAEERTRRMQAHVARCNARIKELEDRIRTDTPRTGVALGARIGVLLSEAEEAAAETMAQAEADGAQIVATATARVAEAEDLMRTTTTRAEEQAIRIETVARSEAAEVVAEAEARAASRTRQIEQWAEQVVSHTRAEEARMFRELQTAREAAMAELQVLTDQRMAAARTLVELREALGHAVGLADPPVDEPTTLVEEVAAPETAVDNPSSLVDDLAAPDTAVDEPAVTSTESGVEGDLEAAPEHTSLPLTAGDDLYLTGFTAPGDEQFETKLDAWVNGGDDSGL